MFIRILGVILIGLSAWAFSAIRPPAPKICGSIGGPPITAPRIKLRDGRHLAYKEHGVSRTTAKYKIIYVHGFANCRHDAIVAVYPSPVSANTTKLGFSTFFLMLPMQLDGDIFSGVLRGTRSLHRLV